MNISQATIAMERALLYVDMMEKIIKGKNDIDQFLEHIQPSALNINTRIII